jgi:hypothetical protein
VFERSEFPSSPNECRKIPFKKAAGRPSFRPFLGRARKGHISFEECSFLVRLLSQAKNEQTLYPSPYL